MQVWAENYNLSDKQVMRMFPRFVGGKAKSCSFNYFTPSSYLPPTERSLKNVFEVTSGSESLSLNPNGAQTTFDTHILVVPASSM